MGRTLLKWRLDSLLGIGGMAAVYAATHLKNRSRVALKVLHRELSANHEIRERFQREAYVANSVDHEGAVEVREDYLSEDDEPVLVMELLRGKPLEAVQAERGTLPAIDVLGYAEQVLDVLAAAHDKGIVHRDVKPQNLFVTQTGRVKVLDFGVARMLDGAASATVTGSLLGTPAFMPPEQASGRTSAICARSDLWSVGATMFTLLTGRFVHEAENAQAHTIKAAVTRARSLATLLPDAPPALIALVDRALAFEIVDRWPDARAMQAAVQRVRGALAPEGESIDEGAETRTFPQGVIAQRAAAPEAASPPPAAPPPAIAPPASPADSDDGDDDETSVAKRDELRAFLPVRPAQQLAEPPTLAPRAQAMADAPRPAPPIVANIPDDSSTTSVIVVPAPAFPARASRPGAPPAPPPPAPPPPGPSAPEAVRAAALALTEVAPLVPARTTEQTLPLSPAPEYAQRLDAPSALSSALPTGPLPAFQPNDPRQAGARDSFPAGVPLFLPGSTSPQTATLPGGGPPPGALPTLDLHAPSQPSALGVSPPEATSVAAQSISQATSPARRPGIRRAELYAIAGAVLAIVIVSSLIVTAVLGNGAAAPASTTGGEGPTLPPTGVELPAQTPGLGTAASSSATPDPAVSGAPSATAEPTATTTATAQSAQAPTATAQATPPAPKPIYRPAVNPADARWPKKKKPFAPDHL